MVDSIEIVTINPDNIYDRLGLCWGHLPEWRDLKIVKESKKWLEAVSAVFGPTTFIAYLNGLPTGMIESVPQRLLMEVGLCPCRVDKEKGETERRYVLGEGFSDYVFVSCLMVSKEQQGKGVGRALLHHFLKSQVFNDSDGALVYVTERDEGWEKYIHWPGGPASFYLKAGFVVEKTLENPRGHILSYRRKSG